MIVIYRYAPTEMLRIPCCQGLPIARTRATNKKRLSLEVKAHYKLFVLCISV